MNKENLIKTMREAIMNSIWIDHVGDIAGVESAAGICAEAALKELGNEWVRVDSGHKPTGRLVLCYTRHHDIYICTYFSNTGVYQIAGEDVTHFITHWQPLPSPPKDK